MSDHKYHIEISLSRQKLSLVAGDTVLQSFDISAAARGAGEMLDSECTPRGRHIIVETAGHDAPVDTVFVGRKPTGEIYTPGLRDRYPGRDWILTRILRLQGMEEGFNRGGEVDTCRRMIYIHGAPDDVAMGVPGSHGCIRMRNADVISLFEKVAPGTEVLISE